MAKPKTKTQKKIDHQICTALTDACEQLLEYIPGFQWLTHHVDYSNFPASLVITCVFDTEESRREAGVNGNADNMRQCIQAKLLSIGVKLTARKQQIVFDSEEACAEQQQGDWELRFRSRARGGIGRGRGNLH